MLLMSIVLANASSYYLHGADVGDSVGVADAFPSLNVRNRVDEVEYIMWAMQFALGIDASYMCIRVSWDQRAQQMEQRGTSSCMR